jgi:hypothetical protein
MHRQRDGAAPVAPPQVHQLALLLLLAVIPVKVSAVDLDEKHGVEAA